MKKRTLTYMVDAGHGWLSVALKDLVELGIADDISNYSFMTDIRAYLEEDSDAPKFAKAVEDAGWDIKIKESYVERSPLRSKASYNPWFAYNPFVVGGKAYYNGVLTRISPDTAVRDDGCRFKIRKSNPLVGLTPIP